MKKNPVRVDYLPHESDRVRLSIEAWNVANGAPFDAMAVGLLMRRCSVQLADLEELRHAVSVLPVMERCSEQSGEEWLEATSAAAGRMARPRLARSVVAGGAR